MTTLCIHSHPSHTASFHFDIYGSAAVFALVFAMAVCAVHGDFAAIPALLCLAAMTSVVFGITQPETVASKACRAHRSKRTEGATYRHTVLLRRHSLEQ